MTSAFWNCSSVCVTFPTASKCTEGTVFPCSFSTLSSVVLNQASTKNLSEWITVQKKNMSWKNHFGTCELMIEFMSPCCLVLQRTSLSERILSDDWKEEKFLNNQDYPLFLLWDSCQLFSDSAAGGFGFVISSYSVILSDFVLMTYSPLIISLNVQYDFSA